ncbi:O-methyltransferase [Mycena belliarum]|uniref:O-methyltransferase n=1 Tax=Mycena belliarum TaxID=1033014 RepID=A0AAD6TNR4_9AGAR|nr:O-methyltransferase [Mycena belliae]
MASTLLELSKLISSSVATVDARCRTLSLKYPDLANPANPQGNEALAHDREIAAATSVALAAAAQLMASMQDPSRALIETSRGFALSSAMGAVNESATAEIIREAGPKGCHINDIAKKNGMDPLKIGRHQSTNSSRLLRLLATQHIFREVSPDVFAHNRISILLDTGKSSQEIFAKPEDKYHGAKGIGALVGLNTDETYKAAAYIQDVVVNPERAAAEGRGLLAMNRAYNTEGSFFSLYDRPENLARFKRFGMAMNADRMLDPHSIVLKGFKWGALPAGALVVDVGGGVGSTSLEIARANPHLRFVVQDLPSVTLEGKEYWAREYPDALTGGIVSLQAHSFLTPQPVKDASVFLVRAVLHNWSDANASKILKNLRDAAQPTTQLVVLERIASLVCEEDASYAHITGAVLLAPPAPLLANLGVMFPYLMDIQARHHSTLLLWDGIERTFPHHWKLFKEAGWEIAHVYRNPGVMDQIIAKPV